MEVGLVDGNGMMVGVYLEQGPLDHRAGFANAITKWKTTACVRESRCHPPLIDALYCQRITSGRDEHENWFETGKSKMRFIISRPFVLALLLCMPITPEASEVNGIVFAVKGQLITIALADPGDADLVTTGDPVSLSFLTADGEVIPIGTCQVSGVKGGGMIEALLMESEVPPTPNLNAVIQTSPGKNQPVEIANPDNPDLAPPPELRPEIVAHTDVTRNLAGTDVGISCGIGKVKVIHEKVNMNISYKKKYAGKYCQFRISDSGLGDFRASVQIAADSENFLTGLFFGVPDEVDSGPASPLTISEAGARSVMVTVGLMTTTSSGSRGRNRSVVSTSWITANSITESGGIDVRLPQKTLDTVLSTHNPLPGTLELIRLGKTWRLVWQGEEQATWSEQFSVGGAISVVFAQIGGKGEVTFSNIRVDQLETREQVPAPEAN